MAKLEWEWTVASDMPKPKGKGLRDDTRELLEILNNNTGNIVKFKFKSGKDCMRAYHRVRDLKNKKRVDYESISRRGNVLYVKVK
jgi:hypothetical protein